jgi:hypothetical protein
MKMDLNRINKYNNNPRTLKFPAYDFFNLNYIFNSQKERVFILNKCSKEFLENQIKNKS